MKKMFLGLLSLGLAFGIAAFTTKQSVPAPFAGEKWFHFIGDASNANDLSDPNMYVLDGTGASPTFCSSTTLTYRCEIKAQPTGSPARPVLNTIVDERKRNTATP